MKPFITEQQLHAYQRYARNCRDRNVRGEKRWRQCKAVADGMRRYTLVVKP